MWQRCGFSHHLNVNVNHAMSRAMRIFWAKTGFVTQHKICGTGSVHILFYVTVFQKHSKFLLPFHIKKSLQRGLLFRRIRYPFKRHY